MRGLYTGDVPHAGCYFAVKILPPTTLHKRPVLSLKKIYIKSVRTGIKEF